MNPAGKYCRIFPSVTDNLSIALTREEEVDSKCSRAVMSPPSKKTQIFPFAKIRLLTSAVWRSEREFKEFLPGIIHFADLAPENSPSVKLRRILWKVKDNPNSSFIIIRTRQEVYAGGKFQLLVT